MRKGIAFAWVIFFFVVACSSAQPTPTVTPSPTITPFSALELDSMLIQPNDLPAGVTGAQISNYEEKSSMVPVPADYFIRQDLAYQDNKRGEVSIWIYEDLANTQLRYEDRVNELKKECAKAAHQCHPGDPKTQADVGEVGKIIDVYNYIGADGFTLVFKQCHAVYEVYMIAIIYEPDGLITYAQRLDKRLKPIVCRE